MKNITKNLFSGNTSGAHGGGAATVYGGSIDANVFNNNIANNCGGLSSNFVITNNTFSGNTARGNNGQNNGMGGGACADRKIINNTFNHNSAAYGGGLYSYGTVANNLFWANTLTNSSIGQGADLYLPNDQDHDGIPESISLVANDFDQTRPSGFYSTVEIAIPPGNLNRVNPLFVASDNLHLNANSPVIDKGDKTVTGLPTTDMDGGPRIVGANVDIGADEYPIARVSIPTVTTNAASNIAATSAILHGQVTSNGATATVTFDFGPTATYGTSIAATPAQVYSSSAVAVAATKAGLTCATPYHFRVKAVNSAGTGLGADKTFTTGTCPTINAWLYPMNPTVVVDSNFVLDIHANSSGVKIGSYDFRINFDKNKLVVDITRCEQGVCPGTAAFDTRTVVTNNDTGTIRLAGFDTEGQGPGNDLQLLVIYFKAKITPGATLVDLTTNELATVLGEVIGLGSRDATVTISPGICGDADGNATVNIVDALAIARAVVGLPPPPTINEVWADVNQNQITNITDAMLIARHSVGMLVVGTCAIGQAL